MCTLALVLDACTVLAAFLSGVFWMRAASVKIKASSDAVGVGFGGVPVNVRDHTGTVIDFLQSYTLQAKWNRRAAFTSGCTGIFGALAFLLHRLTAS